MTAFTDEPLREAVVPSKQGARRHYGSHPYFTKRAWNVVQSYIRHFSAPGDTVLDPFGGSGVTAVESLVLRRKAVYADISEWACFLARQTAVAPVNMGALSDAFQAVERSCCRDLEDIWRTDNRELAKRPVADWYPQGIALPANADVRFVEDLFTPRMLHGLAMLLAAIREVRDPAVRDLLLLAFSSTLARINRTFLSTTNRRASRGGTAIFSIYRYKVAKQAVELPLWQQFTTRVARLMDAKRETNELIGDFYREGDTAVFRHGSATELLHRLKPESVDYIYTDPPYGGHIAYLDLSTMWSAWLGFTISAKDRAAEVIEGGELRKSREVYGHLLGKALEQMVAVLKPKAWMSIVFAHRDTGYWQQLVDACTTAGFRYENTVVQPVSVVWSMHKKKNPLRVLSGELVLNFRKAGPRRRRPGRAGRDPAAVVLACCEERIIEGAGATTEDLHHAVVPALLEAGLLQAFSEQWGDLTPFLEDHFSFDRPAGRWHLREEHQPLARRHARRLVRYHILRFLSVRGSNGGAPTSGEVETYVSSHLTNGQGVTPGTVLRILRQVAFSADATHWQLPDKGRQHQFLFTT